jgi:uncharacterized membrane protein
MHRSHLGLCGIGLALAFGYLVLTGGSAGGVGLLIAALVCPLAVILAMSVLMGRDHQHGSDSAPDETGSMTPPLRHR